MTVLSVSASQDKQIPELNSVNSSWCWWLFRMTAHTLDTWCVYYLQSLNSKSIHSLSLTHSVSPHSALCLSLVHSQQFHDELPNGSTLEPVINNNVAWYSNYKAFVASKTSVQWWLSPSSSFCDSTGWIKIWLTIYSVKIMSFAACTALASSPG